MWPNESLKYRTSPEPVQAPCCGRVTAGDAIIDLTGVLGMPDGYLCDACRERERRLRGIEHSAVMLGLGAPPTEIKLKRAKEILRKRIKVRTEDAGAYDRNVEMKAAMRQAISEIEEKAL